jgi:hypothetical protein
MPHKRPQTAAAKRRKIRLKTERRLKKKGLRLDMLNGILKPHNLRKKPVAE